MSGEEIRSRRLMARFDSLAPEVGQMRGQMSRVIAIVAAVLLCACAAPAKKPSLGWSDYTVEGSVGLVVTSLAPARLVPTDNDAGAALDRASEDKRQEQKKGVAVSAFTILLAPLAIFAPMYPPAIQLAILPFQAIGYTSQVGQDADRLQEAAAKARLDAACSEELAIAHPELAEKLQAAVPMDALLPSIQGEVRESLRERTKVPVVPLEPQATESESWNREAVLKDAAQRDIPTVFAMEIQRLEVRAEAATAKPGDCRYAITTISWITWWSANGAVMVYRADTPAGDGPQPLLVLPDLPALLDQPEALRLRIARAYRDKVMATVEAPTLKFAAAKP
jgi:hypothetical protein